MKILLRSLDNRYHSVDIDPLGTIYDLKRTSASVFSIDINRIRLVFKGDELKNDNFVIKNCNIKYMDNVIVVIKPEKQLSEEEKKLVEEDMQKYKKEILPEIFVVLCHVLKVNEDAIIDELMGQDEIKILLKNEPVKMKKILKDANFMTDLLHSGMEVLTKHIRTENNYTDEEEKEIIDITTVTKVHPKLVTECYTSTENDLEVTAEMIFDLKDE